MGRTFDLNLMKKFVETFGKKYSPLFRLTG